MSITKAIITTLDNLPLLKEQVAILESDSFISEIVVVNNGSIDGTREWLEQQDGLTVIHRSNNGAGPGRNAGLDAAGKFDYVLLLDGGIRHLVNSTAVMLAYLEANPDVNVISPEVASCFTTDPDQAHRRMAKPLTRADCFAQCCLSSTAYALCTAHAWDGLRFSEEGPFAEPGWGVDDNDMMYRWNASRILHHDFTGVQVYRRASGSFNRLFKETGIWPNQYGSVYEKRNVKCWQDWPHYHRGLYQWSGLIKKSFVIGGLELPDLAYKIKEIHNVNQKKGYEIIVNTTDLSQNTLDWLEMVRYRWHWGDTVIDKSGQIIRRNSANEATWTGDVLLDTQPRGEIVNV